MRIVKLCFLMSLIALSNFAFAKTHRSHKAIAEFKLQHPCPVNRATRGKCPGYVIDHVIPLCAGGHDHPSNMQWQALAESKIKDREEWKLCRSMKMGTLRTDSH